jgi:hypothetical protein
VIWHRQTAHSPNNSVAPIPYGSLEEWEMGETERGDDHQTDQMGQGFCPSCLPHLVCSFKGAVLFNGNVESRGAAYLSELLPNV